MASETMIVGDPELRNAINRKATSISGNWELNTFIQQTREFYNQFEIADGVTLYPKKDMKSPDKHPTGYIGRLAGIPIHILTNEEKLGYLMIRCDYE